jgi:adenine/guanine phosphoribosyltransferase-like PRPP-binding protein
LQGDASATAVALRLGRGLLAAKKSRTIPDRDALVADVTAIRNDVRALKQRLTCPADATSVE